MPRKKKQPDQAQIEAGAIRLEQEVQEVINQRRSNPPQIESLDAIRSAAAELDKAIQAFDSISIPAAVQGSYDSRTATELQHEEMREAISEALATVVQVRSTFAEYMPIMASRLQGIEESHSVAALDKIEALESYLYVELEDAGTEFAAYTVWDIIEQGFTPEGEPKDGIFKEIIEKAVKRKREYEKAEVLAEIVATTRERTAKIIAKELEKAKSTKITARPTERVDFPLDKPNREIWDLISGAKYNNQLQLATVTIDTSRGKKKRETGIIYGISFDKLEEAAPNLKITKQLTQYDKRVYIAAAAIFNAGNEVTSATQIYRVMGNTGKPKAADVKKINDSLTKMGAARVYLNNSHEAKTYKGYPVFKYDADLLPFERISASVNGQITETAIHFFREPPLMTFAKERKQITTLPLQLLESPVSKTDANLAIDDYLLERISHIKKGKANPKILYESLYEKCRITTKKQKQRTPEKIRRYLDHYKQCKFIYDYAEESDGIYIYVSRAAKADKNKTP